MNIINPSPHINVNKIIPCCKHNVCCCNALVPIMDTCIRTSQLADHSLCTKHVYTEFTGEDFCPEIKEDNEYHYHLHSHGIWYCKLVSSLTVCSDHLVIQVKVKYVHNSDSSTARVCLVHTNPLPDCQFAIVRCLWSY